MQISIARCDIVGIMETKNPGTPFAERLRQLRQDEGKTQDDVLEYLRQHGVNLKQSALSHYETGRTEPPPSSA
jgi:transcriptional regulator with XRE-family HTH domain